MVFKWFKSLKDGLSKSSEKITVGIKKIFKNKKIDDETLDILSDLLISSDLGIEFSSKVIEDLRKKKIKDPSPKNVKLIIQEKIV